MRGNSRVNFNNFNKRANPGPPVSVEEVVEPKIQKTESNPVQEEKVPIQAKNAVTLLHEKIQHDKIEYKELGRVGPDHKPSFQVAVVIRGKEFYGSGSTKRIAKMLACQNALQDEDLNKPNETKEVKTPPAEKKGFKERKNRGGQNQRHGDKDRDSQKKKILIDENSPVVQEFRKYALQMNDKQDKYERLIKIGRDITIESKRVIFLLHTILRSEPSKVLEEAESRLNKLVETHVKAIQKELEGEDLYQYLRAFTGGMQEFIEAYTFLYYLKQSQLISWKEIDDKIKALNGPESQMTIFTPSDYILGVGDLSGELMRYSINSVVSGTQDDSSKACSFVRNLYVGMIQSNCNRFKEIGRKFSVLKQSMQKMEKAVCTLRLRGSEIPKHMLADTLAATGEKEHEDSNVDEGFY